MARGRDERRSEELGLDAPITRRDFFHLSAVGLAGAGFLACGSGDGSREGTGGGTAGATVGPLEPPDGWYGYGGVGDYADSHGNTPETVRAAHGLRTGAYADAAAEAADTGERYDLVVVGAGLAGLSAAYHFRRLRPKGRCLLLDNHPVFGGEAKRNEFRVDGVRLVGPQGSNDFTVPPATGGPDDYFTALGIPREFEYAPWDAEATGIRIPVDNYGWMHWVEDRYSVGHFFGEPAGGGSGAGAPGAPAAGRWVTDLWGEGLARAPWSPEVREALRRWRRESALDHAPPSAGSGDGEPRWLDRITVKEYYEELLGLPPAATAYVDPILASIIGLGCDAISAWWGWHFGLPGFRSADRYEGVTFHSFPGGNDGIARHVVRSLIPDAIAGGSGFADVLDGPIRFEALDREGAPVRMRLRSTVVRAEHRGGRGASERVRVTYLRDGGLRAVEARGVVMASGGWVNRHVLPELPEGHRRAYGSFRHAPVLVANVALRNWRFLERLGVAACMWSEGFGFSCNIRRPMYTGDHRPPLGPDRPAVLTFYVPFPFPGLPAREQGIRGRTELLRTPFREYERRIRAQMTRLFGEVRPAGGHRRDRPEPVGPRVRGARPGLPHRRGGTARPSGRGSAAVRPHRHRPLGAPGPPELDGCGGRGTARRRGGPRADRVKVERRALRSSSARARRGRRC